MTSTISLGADNRAALRRLAETLALPHLQPGWVWLAGAGPGDPGLASLHTLHAIAEADVILIDALVNKAMLTLARPDARIIDAGKRGGRPSPSQESTSRRLISYARKGLRVLRLKGGDPFVFGRGGEEALALVRANVPFEVVPGVSSIAAVPESVGIPVTHRGVSQMVTAFAANDVEQLDARALAQVPGTLVAFMGGAVVGRLAERLIAEGKPASTPAAVVSRGTTEDEEVVVAPLGGIGEAAR